MAFTFFTVNNFKNENGGSIRISSILNALSNSGIKVSLISNTKKFHLFHSSIEHIYLDSKFSKNQKRVFQVMLIILPNIIISFLFKSFINKIKKLLVISKKNEKHSPIIFCEYFDCSLGYFFKKQDLIDKYIIDLHGIAPLEFKTSSRLIRNKIINFLKYKAALTIDKKVFKDSFGLIFLSEDMKNYMQNEYPFISLKKNFIVPDGISSSLCYKRINTSNLNILKKLLNISDFDKVIFFAGTFKISGGVLDLIEAFNSLITIKKRTNLKLLLVGDGECLKLAKSLVLKFNLESKVIFIGRIPYNQLSSYQELSDIIVCPDRKSILSELVPHIKYFDSLSSNKIVINGSFKSISKINIDERYSINFIPSNVHDLFIKIEMVLNNLDFYKTKYSFNKEKICNKYLYKHSIKSLIDYQN